MTVDGRNAIAYGNGGALTKYEKKKKLREERREGPPAYGKLVSSLELVRTYIVRACVYICIRGDERGEGVGFHILHDAMRRDATRRDVTELQESISWYR